MEAIYDIIESIHVFIPIVAVIFLVGMVFLCGTQRAVVQPPPAYLDHFHQIQPHMSLPKRERKAAAKASPPSQANSNRRSTTGAHELSPKNNNKRATGAHADGSGSRKNTSGHNERTSFSHPSADDRGTEEEWTTVTPKKVRGAKSDAKNDYWPSTSDSAGSSPAKTAAPPINLPGFAGIDNDKPAENRNVKRAKEVFEGHLPTIAKESKSKKEKPLPPAAVSSAESDASPKKQATAPSPSPQKVDADGWQTAPSRSTARRRARRAE